MVVAIPTIHGLQDEFNFEFWYKNPGNLKFAGILILTPILPYPIGASFAVK
jgi:hypothetical protein